MEYTKYYCLDYTSAQNFLRIILVKFSRKVCPLGLIDSKKYCSLLNFFAISNYNKIVAVNLRRGL